MLTVVKVIMIYSSTKTREQMKVNTNFFIVYLT